MHFTVLFVVFATSFNCLSHSIVTFGTFSRNVAGRVVCGEIWRLQLFSCTVAESQYGEVLTYCANNFRNARTYHAW